MNNAVAVQTPCASGQHNVCHVAGCSCSCHFRVQPRKSKKWLVVIGVVIGLGLLGMLSTPRPPETSSSAVPAVPPPAPRLNPQGLTFAVRMEMQEIEYALAGGHAVMPPEEAQRWAGIDLSVPTRVFEADYEENELAGDAKYKGKRFLLSGRVASIEKDFLDNVI